MILNEEMNDILKIVQVLEDSGSLLKGVTETIKNETKEQKRELLGTLLGTLGASLRGNMLAWKEIVRAGYSHGRGIVRAVMEIEWIFNAASSFNKLWNAKIS